MLIPLGKWILPVSSERGSGAIFFGGIARIIVMTATACAATVKVGKSQKVFSIWPQPQKTEPNH